jgi:hypothetical protein
MSVTAMATETETETQPDTQPEAVSAAPAKPDKPADAATKTKGAKKDKKGKGESAVETQDAQGPSVAAHPRASRGVARARGWGGLAGFLIAGYLSLPTSTLAATGLHALLAGVVCYIVAWAGALFVWRRLVILEIKAKEHELIAAVQNARAQRESSGVAAPSAGQPNARKAA